MHYSNRLFLYAPLFLLLALAVAAGMRWEAVAAGVESWLRQHNGHEIAPGVTMRFASEAVSGFPFNVDAVLHDVTFQVKSARTLGVWHTDGFAIHELTFGRAEQIYEAAGTQTISWTNAEGGRHRLAFVPGSLMASAILSGRRLVRFDLDLTGIGAREISGARIQLHLRKAPDRDAIDIVASADQILLAPSVQTGFGSTLRHAAFEARLAPAAPFAILFDGNDEWDHAMETWRRGGALQLGKFEMDWSGVQLHARGNLGLDGEHRPHGMLALTIEGAMEVTPAEDVHERLARAIAQLAKATNEGSRGLSVNIVSGSVNLQLTNAPQIVASAGSLGPLY